MVNNYNATLRNDVNMIVVGSLET
ncbi:hypothetical protein VIBNIWn13_150043 [Vibrio nigripulchritudo Wn13]|nr:hypothetical protein VIBNISFn135_1090043 [Vibrio nigripulchritudo SFn135]CCO51834.1 hypothetical protein VIBNIWn13_150043 [Vibrio nigripulchritudo Wn13]